jgi:hypothetical protein
MLFQRAKKIDNMCQTSFLCEIKKTHTKKWRNESWQRIRVFLPKNRPLTCAGSLQGCAVFKIGHRSKIGDLTRSTGFLKGSGRYFDVTFA